MVWIVIYRTRTAETTAPWKLVDFDCNFELLRRLHALAGGQVCVSTGRGCRPGCPSVQHMKIQILPQRSTCHIFFPGYIFASFRCFISPHRTTTVVYRRLPCTHFEEDKSTPVAMATEIAVWQVRGAKVHPCSSCVQTTERSRRGERGGWQRDASTSSPPSGYGCISDPHQQGTQRHQQYVLLERRTPAGHGRARAPHLLCGSRSRGLKAGLTLFRQHTWYVMRPQQRRGNLRERDASNSDHGTLLTTSSG